MLDKQTCLLFLQRLSSFYGFYMKAWKPDLVLAPFVAIYFVLSQWVFPSVIPQILTQIVVVSFIGYGICITFVEQWFSFHIRCPRCSRMFFYIFEPVYVLSDIEKCRKCRLPLYEIEETAGIKLSFLRRRKNTHS